MKSEINTARNIPDDIRERINGLKRGIIPKDFNWSHDPDPSLPEPFLIRTIPTAENAAKTKIVDEGLRDGFGSIHKFPTSSEMLRYVDSASNLGIDIMTIGIYPGNSRKVDTTIRTLLKEMNNDFSHITPIVLSLTTPQSLEWVSEMKHINDKLQTLIFMGTSPIRMLIQNWNREFVLQQLENATRWANVRGIPVLGATEHTTQTPPGYLKDIIKVFVDNGAYGFCAADTIGTGSPEGIWRQIRFIRSTLDELNAKDISIDFHGHEDMGLSIVNSLTALAAGADRVHVVAGGLGERAGNTSIEGVLVNLNSIIEYHNRHNPDKQISIPWKLPMLTKLVETYLQVTQSSREKQGVQGINAYTTGYGLHADALFKAAELEEAALALGEPDVADTIHSMFQTVYTAVDPRTVGRQHKVVIGPLSGKNTVYLFAMQHNLDHKTLNEKQVDTLLTYARAAGVVVPDNEALTILSNGRGK